MMNRIPVFLLCIGSLFIGTFRHGISSDVYLAAWMIIVSLISCTLLVLDKLDEIKKK
jgi:hypothetical protein